MKIRINYELNKLTPTHPPSFDGSFHYTSFRYTNVFRSFVHLIISPHI